MGNYFLSYGQDTMPRKSRDTIVSSLSSKILSEPHRGCTVAAMFQSFSPALSIGKTRVTVNATVKINYYHSLIV